MDEDALMRMGVLLDSAAGRDYLLTQISNALVKSYREMSSLRDAWVEELGIDCQQLTEHLREFHQNPGEQSAVGYVAQLDCDLAQFRDRYQAAVKDGQTRLWDAVIVTYANARITALQLQALETLIEARAHPTH